MLATELITDISKTTAFEGEWDELAIGAQLPVMAPACALAWWRHLAPASARARIVTVREGESLIGIAPFYVDPAASRGRLDLRLPGIELAGRLAPLASPGREREVAREIARVIALAAPRPDVVALEGSPCTMSWAASLRANWPGRARPPINTYSTHRCPTVSLGGASFEQWLASKSSNFRSQMRRLQRQFTAAGGTERSCTADTLTADIETFMRLHASRWEGRGGSHVLALGERLVGMLQDLGASQLESGRFRLRFLELDGKPVSAQLFVAAGGRVLYVNGGWDERYASLKPPMLAILRMIEEACGRGEQCLDLGIGDQPYKWRFADRDEPVAWTVLLPLRARLPLTGARLAPTVGGAALRRAVKRHLSAPHLDRLRRERERVLSVLEARRG